MSTPIPSAALTASREQFTCADGFVMSARLSRPREPASVPGILFIYEAFGMNEQMDRFADTLAAAGYAVLMPNLFDRGSWFSCIRRIFKDMQAGSGRSVDDLVAARHWLAGQPGVDAGRIAVVGLCMGGGFALLLGRTGLFQVSAPFYGMVPAALDGLCPVVASYGGKDRMLRDDARRLEREVPELGIPADIRIYPQAGHGFMNPPGNAFARVLGAATGGGYEPVAAADAMQRLLAFLALHLAEQG